MLKLGSWKIRWAAVFCLLLAAGLAVSFSDDRRNSGDKAAARNVRVTKPYPRERDEREMRTKNPREEFEAARKRGLTEEEVRGVVEDFVAINLNPKSPDSTADPEDAREEWRRREKWYLDTLVSGFGLSDQQKRQAAGRLRELGERDFNNYQEYLANRKFFNEEAARSGKVSRWSIVEILGSAGWFQDQAHAPWNLCDLDETQKEMIGYSGENGQWIWVDGKQGTLDFGTGERYMNLRYSHPSLNSLISMAGSVFPLSMSQAESLEPFRNASVSCHTPQVATGEFLKQAKFLTAPQLRTVLLFRSDMSRQLMLDLGE